MLPVRLKKRGSLDIPVASTSQVVFGAIAQSDSGPVAFVRQAVTDRTFQ